MKIKLSLLSFVMVFFTPACSFFSSDSEAPAVPQAIEAPADHADADQAADQAPQAPQVASDKAASHPSKNYIEILWAIPAETVDAYLIRYGYSRDKLEFERKLNVNQVETFEDPTHGFVYRHLLEDIAPDKKLYVSLISVRGDLQSEPSQVLEVEAGQ